MSPSQILLLSFLIGAVAGLRSMTAPAIVAWGAHRGWLNLHDTPLSFMGSTASVVIFTLLAVVELVGDQLPSAPSRLKLRVSLRASFLAVFPARELRRRGHNPSCSVWSWELLVALLARLQVTKFAHVS
jgi:hypothetical protein